MRYPILLHAGLLSLIASALAQAAEPADLIFIGRHILPMTAPAATGAEARQASRPARRDQALAVRADRIVWTGPARALKRQQAGLIGPATQQIQLGKRALLPGFIDAHGHLTFQALTVDLANVAAPPVGPVSTMEQLQSTLREYIAEREPAAGAAPPWIIGMGYDDSLLAEQRHPTTRDLDVVSTAHPIALMHVSGHLMAANSRALALAGITADSPDPQGGIIRRWPGTQAPNGVLEETATYPLRGFLAGSPSAMVANLQKALALYASNGITTVQDGATAPASVELIRAAAAAEALSQDVVYYPVQQAITPVAEALTVGRYQGRAKAGGVKLILDGSPQGKTAYLSQPYAVPPDGRDADYRGYPTHPPAKVSAMVDYYLSAGIPILAHANGDAAAELLINAVADSEFERDHRTVMIHAQTVRDDQLKRMVRLGINPSFFSTHTFFWGDWHRDSVLGLARAQRISPTRSAAALGLQFTVHNDAPIVPPDMIRLLWATVNRETRSGQVLGPAQQVDAYTALLGMTRHAAYQHFEEDRKGTLEAGKLADLVVLSADPLTLQAEDLLTLAVEATYSHGRQIFSRDAN